MTATTPTASSRWHLLGAGSLGCLFAAYLIRAGVPLQLLLRDTDDLAQLHERGGITLQRDGVDSLVPVAATTAAAADAPIDRLIVSTKAQQTMAALASLKHLLGARPLLVLLQNGMGVRELLQRELPDAIVVHALSTEGAYQLQRFHVVHAGHGETAFGSVEPVQRFHVDLALHALRCELPMLAVDDIELRLWRKLAVNSVINPLTALHGCRNGELLDIPSIDSTIDALCAELAAVARAEGQALDEQLARTSVYAVIRGTASNRSSMLQDRLACRRSEIDFINGFVVARAAAHGIACPQHRALLDSIKIVEADFAAPTT